MAELPQGLVWLASYPKSGNTWMRLLLSNLLGGREDAEDINDMSMRGVIATARPPFEEEVAIDSTLLTLAETERMRPAVHDEVAAGRGESGVVKVHDAFVHLPDGTPLLGRRARAALYLVRDPRDVAVSFAFHSDDAVAVSVRQMVDPQALVRNNGTQLDHRLLGWGQHVASWVDQSDVPVLAIRYEDLHADTAATFARGLDFLGARWTDSELVRAVRHASFAELQRQEAESGFRERVSGGAPFFRSGQVGGWRAHLGADQAAEIEAAHGAVMARFGYGDAGRDDGRTP